MLHMRGLQRLLEALGLALQAGDLGLEMRHALVSLDRALARVGEQLAPLGSEGGALPLPLCGALCVQLCHRGRRLPLEGGRISTLLLERTAITLRLERVAHQPHLRLCAQLVLHVEQLARGHQLPLKARVALGLMGQRHSSHVLVDEEEHVEPDVAALLREDGRPLAVEPRQAPRREGEGAEVPIEGTGARVELGMARARGRRGGEPCVAATATTRVAAAVAGSHGAEVVRQQLAEQHQVPPLEEVIGGVHVGHGAHLGVVLALPR